MIDRYSTPAMMNIWSRQAKYECWKQVELAICEAYSEAGLFPASELAEIQQHASFTLERCDEIEEVTRHDLMAFVRCLSENVNNATALDPKPGRWIHFGVTSYDVIDTALGIMLRDSCDVLISSVGSLRQELRTLFDRAGHHPCIGRTHGIHAEPVTFGHKVEGWYYELERAEARFQQCRQEVAVGKVSGAVGIHAHVDRDLEARICTNLGLIAAKNSTQIVARDSHAHLLGACAVLAGSLERIATELRNLQRTEILEVQEEFRAGQTGSSAMPHKRNPWQSETVCGLARVIRANAGAMFEAIMTWHERDNSNSATERIVFPDTFTMLDFMIHRMVAQIRGLVVMPENMLRNLRQMGDLVFSEHVMVTLIQKGLSREDAYKVAQRNAARSWDEAKDFRTCVAEDSDVTQRLTSEEVDHLFSLEAHLRNAPKSLA
ncbi:MAG: adenylosuccinate lyase [Chthonomonas sp.]|nr:adenylosuccinate lyase [Chthonomonas sp.]